MPFSLLSGPEQTFGEKAYFCTQELDTSQRSSLILRLLGLQCFASMPQSSPSHQTKAAVWKLPVGEDPQPMLSHGLCPGVLWDAAGWAKTMPGVVPAIWPCGQLGSSYWERSLCLLKSLSRKKRIHLLYSTQNPEA